MRSFDHPAMSRRRNRKRTPNGAPKPAAPPARVEAEAAGAPKAADAPAEPAVDEFSSMEIDFFSRAEELYVQTTESWDDLEDFDRKR